MEEESQQSERAGERETETGQQEEGEKGEGGTARGGAGRRRKRSAGVLGLAFPKISSAKLFPFKRAHKCPLISSLKQFSLITVINTWYNIVTLRTISSTDVFRMNVGEDIYF